MLIGILQAGHAPEQVQQKHGDFNNMFARILNGQGFTFKKWDVVAGEFPVSVNDADGWLITGSKHGAYDDIPFIPILEKFIRAAYDGDTPMVGVCFGHQIIAQAMGGKVEKFLGGWAVGHQEYTYNGEKIALNAWHQDQVIEVPKTATVLGANGHCRNAMLIYGNNFFTTQPHPELNNQIIDEYLDLGTGHASCPPDMIDKAKKDVLTPTDDSKLAADIAAFFKGTFNPTGAL